MVLITQAHDALWVTSWPYAAYTRHQWRGAWVCSLFRNEGLYLSSNLIRSAVSATRAYFGEPPAEGIVTFVNACKIRSKRDPGRCFRRAGWAQVGYTKGGLLVLQQLPGDMPPANSVCCASDPEAVA
jgi:hypothetical protein